MLALGALAALAIGMRSMSFREAQAFGREEAGSVGVVSLQLVDSVLAIPLETQLIIWLLFVLMFVLIGLLLSPEMRKRLIQIAIRVAVTYWALYLLFTRYREVLAQMVLNFAPPGENSASNSAGETVPVFTPPHSASWLSYLLGFGIAVALMILVWKAYSIWQELNAPTGASPLNKLARIARSSLHDLSAGRDSTDVIVNCYYRMSEVVAEKKKLDRKESMTPGEFAIRLEQAGLPGDAVKRLTRLFESVRYGGHTSDSVAVNEAITCLTTILRHCGETV